MVTYTVHEAPQPPADRVDRADALAFVKDGFSWPTAVFPPIGLVSEKLWLPLVGYLVGVLTVVAALKAIGANAAYATVLVTALNVYLGFELSSVKRWMLDREGWSTLGAVTGRDLDDCERRFLESWLPSQPVIVASRMTGSAAPFAPKAALKFSGLWPFGTGA